MAAALHSTCPPLAARLLRDAEAKLPLAPGAPLDGGWLRRCASSASASTSLRAAGNLAPAGTGSSSLYASLRALSPTNTRLHHSHGWRIGMAVGCYDIPPAVEGGERPHPCGPHTCCTCPHCNRTETAAPTPHAERPAYVMTLRDPAARFESMVLYALSEWRRGGPATTCTICSVNRFRWRSARAYLDDFRNSSAARHREAVKEYRSSVARPHFSHRVGTIFGGNNLMTAQADYLRNLNCSEASADFVCQERFDADWAALVRADGSLDPATQASVVNEQRRSAAAHPDDVAASRLSAEDASFVRRCMWPWDARLHALACGGARE